MKQKYYKLPVRLEKLFEGDIRQLEDVPNWNPSTSTSNCC